MRKPVRQEDGLGCAVACIAFVLNIPYSEAVMMFVDGNTRVKEQANFYCPELVQILNNSDKKYSWVKVNETNKNLIEIDFAIVFIKRSKEYPFGHFLCSYQNKWMDPWINLPERKRKAGFRDTLPGEPTYVVYTV